MGDRGPAPGGGRATGSWISSHRQTPTVFATHPSPRAPHHGGFARGLRRPPRAPSHRSRVESALLFLAERELPRRLGVGGWIGRRVSKALLDFLLEFRGVGDAFIGHHLASIVERHRPGRGPAAAAREDRLSASGGDREDEHEPHSAEDARRAPRDRRRPAPHSKRSGCSLTMRA
jgi:hypothetical protein